MRHLAAALLAVTSIVAVATPALAAEPPVVTATPNRQIFYPVQDGFRDSVHVTVVSDVDGMAVSQVFDEDGAVVGDARYVAVTAGVPASGAYLSILQGADRAGVYTFRITVTDALDNATVVEVPVTASMATIVDKRVTIHRAAKKTVLDRYVGSCSRLASPSSHGWRRSLGYYSRATCRRGGNPSVVATTNIAWLPPSLQDNYGRNGLEVAVTGTRAKGQREAYLVLGIYQKSDDSFTHRKVVRATSGKVRTTRLKQVGPRQYVRHGTDGRSYVIWGAGLSEGSRFDVKRFQVTFWRRLLVDTDGTVLLPRPTHRPTGRPSGPSVVSTVSAAAVGADAGRTAGTDAP